MSPARKELAKRVEAALRRERIPYVLVEEAAEALLPDPPNGSRPVDAPPVFWAVFYMAEGPNLLVWWGAPTPRRIGFMRLWAQLFGAGFSPAYLDTRDGRLRVVAEEGAPLLELEPAPEGGSASPGFSGPVGVFGQPVADGSRQSDLFAGYDPGAGPERKPPPRKGSPEWMARIYAPALAGTPSLF